MRKKLFSLITCITIGICTMTACGENEPDKKPEPNIQEEAVEKESLENAEAVVTEQVEIDETVSFAENTQDNIITEEPENYISKAFYGIWCSASKDQKEMDDLAAKMNMDYGIPARVYITSDWENLNSETWYAVSAGAYETEEEAKRNLVKVQSIYSDAYVKYSGDLIEGEKVFVTCYSLESIIEGDNFFEFEVIVQESNVNDILRIDENTEFAPSCDMQYFTNYQQGDSVLEWYKRSYHLAMDGEPTMDVLGVFEVSLTGNHVDKIYGTYWWD